MDQLLQKSRIFVKSVGEPPNMAVVSPAASTSQNGNERKVFIVRGNKRVPAFVVPSSRRVAPNVPAEPEASTNSEVLSSATEAVKEVKKEPLDEETPGAVANITESRPIDLQDFMNASLPTVLNACFSNSPKRQDSEKDGAGKSHHQNREPIDRNITSSLNRHIFSHSTEMETLKRTRKPTRNDDYVYDNPLFNSKCDGQLEAKKTKWEGQTSECRCEYVVPELEQRMDRIIDKMNIIETLAKSMLVKEQTKVVEYNAELTSAHNEIQQLRRQLIIQRNQKSLQPEN